MTLTTEPNFSNPDAFFAALNEAYSGLPTEELQALNARLVLILANHIGQTDVLEAALTRARISGKDVRIKRSAA